MIRVRVDDLAFVEADAIARPVNAALGATTPAIRRLELAGGESLLRQLRTNEPLAVGSAVVTGAGDLGAELLIHAVVSSDNEGVSRGSVRRATLSALQRAHDFHIERLAIAPFGLGAGNLDVEDSADVMLDVITQNVANSRFPTEITIVVENAFEEEVFVSRLTRALL